MDIKGMNTTALAYIGDSIYELYVRKYVLGTGQANVDRLHRMAVKYVRAEGQASAMKRIIDSLTPEEQTLAKRARNRKITSKPKNVDPVTYKLATAFEALIGYMYLAGQIERMEQVIDRTIAIIDENGAANDTRGEKKGE